jgi:sigma-E factor negative regulatory protein RseA
MAAASGMQGTAAASATRLGQLRRRHAWLAPTAVAAGFMAVAGALLVVQMSGPENLGTGATLAEAQRSGTGLRLVGGVAPVGAQSAPAPAPVMDSQFIRDAQIDRLLEAHRGAMGGAMVVPGGMKRHLDPVMPAAATVVVPGAVPAPLR